MVWLEWVLQFFISFIIFWVVFYLPGKVIKEKWFLKIPEVVCWILGLAMWGWQAYVLGWLRLRWLTYLYILFFLFFGKRWLVPKVKKINWKLVLIFLIGAVVMLPGVFLSGLPSKDGIRILGINRIDGSYHLALIESLKKSVPPMEPGMVIEKVKNYHYWSDMVLAEILRIFPLNNFWFFYHYFPVLIMILLVGITFELGKTVFAKEKAGYIFSILFVLAGNFDWLFWLIVKGQLTFELASLDNAAILFTNPPRVLAELVWMGGMIIMWQWIKNKKEGWGWLTVLVLTTTVGLKIYVGIAAVIQLIILGGWWLLKKEYKNLRPLMAAAVLAAFIFLPGNYGAGGFKWEPFAWPRQYFAEGKAGTLMWQNQEDEFEVHNNQLRLTVLHWQMLLSFILILSGVRILGFLGMKNFLKNIFGWGLLIVMVFFFFIGLFFVQQSGPFELFNFLAVAEVILTLMLVGWLENKNIWLALIAIFLMLPRPICQSVKYIGDFLGDNIGNVLNLENEDIKFFKEAGRMTENEGVLTDTKNDLGKFTPYTVQLARWKLYFDGDGVLRAHGLDTREIKAEIENWIDNLNSKKTIEELKMKDIKYLYLDGSSKVNVDFLLPILLKGQNRLYKLW